MVKITLPNPDNFGGDIKHYLRQLELAVHHAQKAWDAIETDDLMPDPEARFVTYRFPFLDLEKSDPDGNVVMRVDDLRGAIMTIEIEIASI